MPNKRSSQEFSTFSGMLRSDEDTSAGIRKRQTTPTLPSTLEFPLKYYLPYF